MKRAAKAKSTRLAPIVKIVLICAATYLGLFAMLYGGITPEQYDIKVGVPAPTLIKATKDIQDTVTTEALREEAANAVEPSYKSTDPTVVEAVVSDLNARFQALRNLRGEQTGGSARALSDTELAAINDSLSMSLTREQIAALAETDDGTLEESFAAALEQVREVLDATLPEGQEANALKSIRADLSKLYSVQLTGLVTEAVRVCLRPNMLIDEEITETNRDKAREAVQPVLYVKDQVIVSEGEIVTLAQYTMISSMGILSDNSFDLHMLGGVALLVLLILLSLCAYLRQFNPDILNNPKMMLLLCLIMLLQVSWSLLMRLVNPYLMPVSLGLLLVSLLLDVRLAIFVNMVLALLTSPLSATASGMFTIASMTILASPVIATLLSHKVVRTTTLLGGVIVAAINFLITLAFGLFNSAELQAVVINALWAAAGGAASAILCIAFQPLLEWLFNLATASKLIELSNPNQPLLRRLLLEASGTYHHSIIVANLAEAGCTAIGANGLLARVGAYYHDIGKLKRPMYFKENQMGDNPHDRTDPRVSTAILTAHTRDGAQLAQKARIPEPVVDIIRQHHGDAPVLFFYDKALKLYGDQVDISAFRYEGPRPQSREAAIVMLADGIEAATRALPNPDPEKIDALIRKLVRGRLNDGQLDSSNLTFNDLDKICSAFSTVLTGVFHERIEYPDVAIPPRSDAASENAQAPANAQPQNTAAAQAAPQSAATTGVQPQAKPAVAPGQPVSPVQTAPTAAQAAPQSAATTGVQPQAKPAVAPGQPVSPVQTAPTAAQAAPQSAASTGVHPQAKPAVAPGQPAPPVQTAPTARPAMAVGQPVPPVREDEPAKGVSADGH